MVEQRRQQSFRYNPEEKQKAIERILKERVERRKQEKIPSKHTTNNVPIRHHSKFVPRFKSKFSPTFKSKFSPTFKSKFSPTFKSKFSNQFNSQFKSRWEQLVEQRRQQRGAYSPEERGKVIKKILKKRSAEGQ